ncbi:hypothetical protein KKC88_00400 [Patescibacteria group bacterium]|nr:hypothetical protein [Patescibacteria group bacterium]MBU1674029.1 hypothetical protein [Patescibacteria group bacterium]MBU1963177.1 hypothetical protein [Patescibacteria group bacterium]
MKINKNIIIYVIAIGIGIFFFLFISSSTLIGNSVEQKCEIAQAKYEGDCVEALILFVDDDENGYEERNSAIWALGQLGDERAMDVLNKYYTGDIPDREPLEEGISQYELKKAINLAGGGFNITAFIWRSRI